MVRARLFQGRWRRNIDRYRPLHAGGRGLGARGCPTDLIKGDLARVWGDPEQKKHLLFLLYMRLGRIWRVETRNIENTEGRPCDLVLARETEEQADRCGSLLRRSPSLPTL